MASGIFRARQKPCGGSGVLRLFAPALRPAMVERACFLLACPQTIVRKRGNPWMTHFLALDDHALRVLDGCLNRLSFRRHFAMARLAYPTGPGS
jgi:hypothetical protein